jgi:hypothetical protein
LRMFDRVELMRFAFLGSQHFFMHLNLASTMGVALKEIC